MKNSVVSTSIPLTPVSFISTPLAHSNVWWFSSCNNTVLFFGRFLCLIVWIEKIKIFFLQIEYFFLQIEYFFIPWLILLLKNQLTLIWKSFFFSLAFKKFIVFATRFDLRLVSFDVKYKVDFTLPITTTRYVRAVDYDPVDKMIYWADDSKDGVIMRSFLNGSCEFIYLFVLLRQQYLLTSVTSTPKNLNFSWH